MLDTTHALITDPTWIFFLVLCIILGAPLLLRRLRVPHIIGLILAGIAVGQHGFNILERDASFELFGQVGIYYIMFLAGLELDMGSIIHHGKKGLQFGALTFAIPFVMGYVAMHNLLGYDAAASLMMSCLFSSHTLVSYPIVSRYGMGKHPSVVVSVVATAFTTFLSLLVLAFVIGSRRPDADWFYWLFFSGKCIVYGIVVIVGFPWMAQRFLRRFDDSVMLFVFILAQVFLSAALAKLAGLEGLLGAFLAGLVINRLIPHTSPLMTRLEFVGNALFIPYFLIGVGMIIDVRVLLEDTAGLLTIGIVVAVAMLSKWMAAWFMTMGKNAESGSRMLMFGLSNAHAAGALAIVMIGTEQGLMDNSMLNSAVTLILFSCIVSSLATNDGARRLVLETNETKKNRGSYHGKCLVTYDHPETVDRLTQLAILIRNPFIHDSLMGVSVIFDDEQADGRESLIAMEESDSNEQMLYSKHNLVEAKRIAAAADVQMTTLRRVSTNIASGILHTMKEQDVGEVILGAHLLDGDAPAGSLGTVVDGVLRGSHREVMVAHILSAPGTLRNVIVAVPEKAEYEVGFYKWVEHICRMGEQLDCHLIFHGWAKTLGLICEYLVTNHPNVRSKCHMVENWNEMIHTCATRQRGDMAIIVSSRPGFISYEAAMDQLPKKLARHFKGMSTMLLYPDQYGDPSESMTIFAPNGAAITRGATNGTLGRVLALQKKKKETT